MKKRHHLNLVTRFIRLHKAKPEHPGIRREQKKSVVDELYSIQGRGDVVRQTEPRSRVLSPDVVRLRELQKKGILGRGVCQ